MEIHDAEPSNGEGAGRAKAIVRRRVVFAMIARVLPWIRLVNIVFNVVPSDLIILLGCSCFRLALYG
jgi:hypothetical protein